MFWPSLALVCAAVWAVSWEELASPVTGPVAGPVELFNTRLEGNIHPDNKSAVFQLNGTAKVTKPGAVLTILSGNAAASTVPDERDTLRVDA